MKQLVVKLSLIFLWLLFVGAVFFSSQKSELILNPSIKKNLNVVFPEGWSFFTKNPREAILNVYEIKDNALESHTMLNQSPSNYFGLSRKSRIIGYEESIIVSKIDAKYWRGSTTNNLKRHIADSAIVVKYNPLLKSFGRGEYLFVSYYPIPYAWANNNQEKNNPISVLKIHIK